MTVTPFNLVDSNGVIMGTAGNPFFTSASGSSCSSSSVGGGNSTYSNVQGDFTATPTVGTKNIVLSAYASTILSASITINTFLNAIIERITTAGSVTTLPMTTLSWALGTNTLTVTDMAANFAIGDTVAMFVPGNDKYFDAARNALLAEGNVASGATDVANPLK